MQGPVFVLREDGVLGQWAEGCTAPTRPPEVGQGGGGRAAGPAGWRSERGACAARQKANEITQGKLGWRQNTFNFLTPPLFSPELFAFAKARETNETLKMESPGLRK